MNPPYTQPPKHYVASAVTYLELAADATRDGRDIRAVEFKQAAQRVLRTASHLLEAELQEALG